LKIILPDGKIREREIEKEKKREEKLEVFYFKLNFGV
jgi:hypothetical protein